MTDLIGLLLGLLEDLKFWKKRKKRRELEKEKNLPKKVMFDLSAKVLIAALIIIFLLKLYKYLCH